MASTTIKALRQTLPRRSLRILVSPTPITFAERRSVLQALQQFGPVEFFQMTPGYHSNYISVTRDAATARELVTRSPLSYRISTSPSNTKPQIEESNTSDSAKLDETQEESASGGAGDSDKEFKLQIFPEPNYSHESAMSRSTLAQAWPSSYSRDKSFLSTTLKQSLPPSVAANGLAHWLVNFDDAPNASAKTSRLVSKSWLPSVMAKEPAVDEEAHLAPRSHKHSTRHRANHGRHGPSRRVNIW